MLKKIAVLASGNGTNLQALIDAINTGFIKNAEINVVISNRKQAYALERARNNDIEALWINSKEFLDCDEYNERILSELKSRGIDLVLLAGYMKVLNWKFARDFEGRIMNVHPSLIPAFCGKGFYGNRVHEAVLASGVKITGATVHFVDEGIDTGPIILQKAIMVRPDETVESLKERVLEVEHRLYPLAVKLFCENRLRVIGKKVIILPQTKQRRRNECQEEL
ncbi:MAG: phosphoribosylglycinamide formyltransferase [Kosmotoga sp.]|nr:phosphoribosylglycinamide formyltransferase [Kosmotoga sp.]MCD6159723.1 phosphoribosylglycinamide formyltransferase [Kosmotoga sp.]